MDSACSEPGWNDAYEEIAAKHLKTYFGSFGGVTSSFPCMREDYPWGDNRPEVPDSRIPAKNNTEYHGLESHANQYHAAAMYAEASHHWLLAAWYRQIDKVTHRFDDVAHDVALSFCLKNHMFNEALDIWSKGGGERIAPEAEAFGLTAQQANRLEETGRNALGSKLEEPQKRSAD